MHYSLLAVCLLLLITCSEGTPHSQAYGTRLASPSSSGHGALQKRAPSSSTTATHYTWWRWSSTTGYQSGTSDSPPSEQSESETTSPAPTSENENYSPPSTSPAPQSSQTGYTKPSGGSGYKPAAGSDIQTWLDQHNKFRRQYGVPDLQWNPNLVAASQTLTDKCLWQHTQHNKYGENMAAGQSSIKEVVEGWVSGPSEKGSYQPSNPVPSHFTQVVWVGTTHVGCHMTSCRNVQGAGLPQSPVQFFGCNYDPPGNVIGQFAENVKATAGGRPAV